jgi:hypothetical protein
MYMSLLCAGGAAQVWGSKFPIILRVSYYRAENGNASAMKMLPIQYILLYSFFNGWAAQLVCNGAVANMAAATRGPAEK